jgi:excisionase family DNA binding protein
MKKKAYSIAETAELCGLGITKIKEAIRAGALEARKAGRRTVITDEDLTAWIAGLPKARPYSSHHTQGGPHEHE